jgi:exopolysaccharide biosynthesis protein
VPTQTKEWGRKTREEVLYGPHADAFILGENGKPCAYLDGTISVRIEERTIKKTRVMFTWIQIADPTQLRSQFCQPYPSESAQYATQIAAREHAVVALNGDYCTGIKAGVVIRNGVEFRRVDPGQYDQLIIDRKGDFHILRQPKLEEFDAWEGEVLHSFVFGPGLVIDGVLQDIGTPRNYASNMNFQVSAQRQVICQMDTLSYLLITTEGPEQSKKGGFSLYEMAQMAYDCGAQQAYTLDGGSSTWLVLGDERISNSNGRKLRPITDIIYFVTAEPDPAGTAP